MGTVHITYMYSIYFLLTVAVISVFYIYKTLGVSIALDIILLSTCSTQQNCPKHCQSDREFV